MKKYFMNTSGMSILEIMIAIGLAGGLTIIIMKNMDNMNKSAKSQKLNTEVENLKRTIQDFVGRGEPCKASFAHHMRGQPVKYLDTKENATIHFAETDKEFQKTGLIIKKMQLLSLADEIKKTRAYNKLSTQGTVGIGLTYLRVWVEKKKNSSGIQDFYGGKDSFFDVPIVGLFDGEDIFVKDASSCKEARDTWRPKFVAEALVQKNKVDAELNAAKAADPANAAIYTEAQNDITLLAEDNKDGSAGKEYPLCDASGMPTEPDMSGQAVCKQDPEIGAGSEGPYVQDSVTGDWSFTWSVAHPLYPISDCGNHLSTGVN